MLITSIDKPSLLGIIWKLRLGGRTIKKQETILNSLEISDNVVLNISDQNSNTYGL